MPLIDWLQLKSGILSYEFDDRVAFGLELSSFTILLSLKVKKPFEAKKDGKDKMPSVDTMSKIRRDTKFDHLIPQVRQLIRDALTKDHSHDDTYYEFDFNRAMKDDWQIRRFLLHKHGCVESTVDAIISAWKLTKTLKLRELKDSDFPKEMFEASAIFLYEPDIDGRPTVYIRSKMALALMKEANDLKTQFILYNTLKADDLAGVDGFTVIVDVRNTTLQNVDLDVAFSLLAVGHHFPYTSSKVILVEIPWLVRPAFHLVKVAMPATLRNMLIHVLSPDVTKYVSRENLPYFLGGECSRPYCGPCVVPRDSGLLAQYCTDVLNVSAEKIDKFTSAYHGLLQKIQHEIDRFDENSNVTRDRSESKISHFEKSKKKSKPTDREMLPA